MPTPRPTVGYRLRCDFGSEVRGPPTFVFNVEVARLRRHLDLVETLTLSPDAERRT